MSETNENPSRSLPPFAELRVNELEMYDHLPYHKDVELCPPEMIKMVSGNVVKYYTIQEDQSQTIDTNDLAEHLVERGRNASRHYHSHDILDSENVIDAEEFHEEDISTSPADTPPSVTPPSATSGKAPKSKQTGDKQITNAFSGLEDDEDEDDFSFLRGGK